MNEPLDFSSVIKNNNLFNETHQSLADV